MTTKITFKLKDAEGVVEFKTENATALVTSKAWDLVAAALGINIDEYRQRPTECGTGGQDNERS